MKLADRLDERAKDMDSFSFLRGMITAFAAILLWITLIIRLTAGDGGYLAAQMLEHAAPESTGLPEAEYPGMGCMVADYLTGKTDTFQYTFTDDSGKTWQCFHDYEAAHMADCRLLIQKDEAFAITSAVLILVMAGLHFLPVQKDGRRFARGIIWGIRFMTGIAVLLTLWAALDFSGFFITFHELAFSNDGWLLNPRTDMLIRLMPEEFFISLGVRGIWLALTAPVMLEIAARLALGKRPGSGSHRSGDTETGSNENDV